MPAARTERANIWWSYSSSRQLHDCPRQFQYSQDAAPARGSPGSVGVHALVGLAVHETVSAEVEEWAKGRFTQKVRAQDAAERFIKAIWANRKQRITEFANGLPEKAAPDLAYLVKAARVRVGRFFEMIWPTFSEYKHHSHEQLATLDVGAAKVAVKIDFACWTAAGDLLIVDWKTGGAENMAAGRVQLAIYTLWAHRALGLDFGKIRPAIVSIATGERVEYAPTSMDVEAVESLIQADLAAIADMRKAGAFPARPEFELCLGCRFLPSCPEGASAVSVAYKAG